MAPGLCLITQDAALVEQLRNRLVGRYDLVVVDSIEAAVACRQSTDIDAVLVDLDQRILGDRAPGTFFEKLRQASSSAMVIGMIGPGSPASVRGRVKENVGVCLEWPGELDQLDAVLERTARDGEDLSRAFPGLPHRRLRGRTRSLVTFTPSMFEMLEELEVAAAHEVTVLLIGETGSGKTHLARVIHELSHRVEHRCLTVACGALPPDLIESELFGYVKGAFTGADGNKQGKFAAAASGTLLLDEIDVLAPEQQAKLLRVIETGEYEPVGSNETQVSTARLIAASNIDLEQLVKVDRFRMDLFYRLNTLSFHLPPLRDRPWDIEYLARKFAVAHGHTHHVELHEIEPKFLAALRQYRWPGNIRELENVVRRAVLYCHDGILTVADLPISLRPKGTTRTRPAGNLNARLGVNRVNENVQKSGTDQTSVGLREPMTLEARVDEVEQRIIEETLHRHSQRRTDTARELGISRVTLYNKMKKFRMFN